VEAAAPAAAAVEAANLAVAVVVFGEALSVAAEG
jgi:hypothetical protein